MSDHDDHRRKDRHRSPFMIRLPEIFRDKLQQHSARSNKSMTALVKAALKQFLRRADLWTRDDDAALAEQEGRTPK
ncbi:MAG: hypothetical protein JNM56_05500 [Planctomycetia bacterium]|nr:hypothetical protein [Planctomycetia bacterium]